MWNIEAITGYHPMTTFWDDFTIADHFGANSVKDTYRRAFKEWKTDYKYLTEFVMVLNWKIWEHDKAGNHVYAGLYNDLWDKADSYAMKSLKGDELEYFLKTTA